jgi:hypothetical protein
VQKSQLKRLIGMCVGTTQCCPGQEAIFWPGARRRES